MKTEEKMLHILEKNCADALESGILVALSGGADSCALALLLKNLSCKIAEKHTNFRLCCAHFNHCIRGEAAREDENFVRAFVRNMRLNYLAKRRMFRHMPMKTAFRQKQRRGNCVMTFLSAQGLKAAWDLLQQLIICRTMRKAYCCIFYAEAGLTGCAE